MFYEKQDNSCHHEHLEYKFEMKDLDQINKEVNVSEESCISENNEGLNQDDDQDNISNPL